MKRSNYLTVISTVQLVMLYLPTLAAIVCVCVRAWWYVKERREAKRHQGYELIEDDGRRH